MTEYGVRLHKLDINVTVDGKPVMPIHWKIDNINGHMKITVEGMIIEEPTATTKKEIK